MPRIFLLRHAESTFNAEWDATGTDSGHPDARLTTLGHAQVRALAPSIKSLAPDLVIASPFTRTIETALGLFAGHPSTPPIRVEPSARCRFAGDSCDFGRPPSDLARSFPSLDFTSLVDDWWNWEPRPSLDLRPEPHDLHADRVHAFAASLRARPEPTILVVDHDDTFRVLTGVDLANAELIEWLPA